MNGVRTAPPTPRLVRTTELMGTVFSVHVVGAHADAARAEAATAGAFAELDELERIFSPFRPDSAISRIRRGTARVDAVDARVAEVEQACRTAQSVTAGRFSAWREGWFDPTGYVKGWAAETVASRWLEPLVHGGGAAAVGINAGGDVRVFTADAEARTWRIGIADPQRPGAVLALVELRTGAVATSGTAERGAHILDPRSGEPAVALRQASVVAGDLATADLWATSAMVAGGDLSWVRDAPVSGGLVVGADGSVRRWAGGVEVSGVNWTSALAPLAG